MTYGMPAGNRNLWIGIGIAGAAIAGVVILLLLLGGGDDEAGPTSTSTTSTTEAPTTTTAAETTTSTTAASTTTAQPSGTLVAETPLVGILQPYNDGGAGLFAPGSVEAHWYRWDDVYVVLYRGIDADSAPPLCPGSSVQTEAGFAHVSNSPFDGAISEVCVDAPRIAGGEAGVRSCDWLLYYVTEIPIDVAGTLYATIEVNDGSGFVGQTSQVTADGSAAPEFEPFQAAYTLPPSAVDDGGVVLCGS